MPDLRRNLTEDEYKDRLEQQTMQVASEFILATSLDGIDEIVIEEYAMEAIHLQSDYWEDATCESIARHADNENFDPFEDLRLAAPADDLIRSIAYQTLVTAVVDELKPHAEKLDQAHMVHTFLNRLVDGVDDDPEQPSILLKSFNRWLTRELSANNVEESPIEYKDFNERHIRGFEAIDATNEALIDYLWEWLHDTYDRFPDVLQEN